MINWKADKRTGWLFYTLCCPPGMRRAQTERHRGRLEVHLPDKARGIRNDVCYILRKHMDFDIFSYDKSRLHTPKEAVAIWKIRENGGKEDAILLTEYLYAASEKLVKCAMKALSVLGASGFDAIYWERLLYLQLPCKSYSASSGSEEDTMQLLIRRAISFRSVYAKITEKQTAFIYEVMI